VSSYADLIEHLWLGNDPSYLPTRLKSNLGEFLVSEVWWFLLYYIDHDVGVGVGGKREKFGWEWIILLHIRDN